MSGEQTHIAILHRKYLDLVLSGAKTVELRLTKTRRAPFGVITPGERIYFKQSSGPFRATARAGRVETHEDLTPVSARALIATHNHEICADRATADRKAQGRFATLIWLEDVEAIGFGPDLSGVVRPGSRSAWHVVDPALCVYPACVSRPGSEVAG